MSNIIEQKEGNHTNKKALKALVDILGEFRKLDGEMQIQTMLTFLHIATKDNQTVGDIGEALGLATSSASRNVAALSKYHRMRKPGHDLVRAEEDVMNRRQKLLTLTSKGQRMVARLTGLLKGVRE